MFSHPPVCWLCPLQWGCGGWEAAGSCGRRREAAESPAAAAGPGWRWRPARSRRAPPAAHQSSNADKELECLQFVLVGEISPYESCVRTMHAIVGHKKYNKGESNVVDGCAHKSGDAPYGLRNYCTCRTVKWMSSASPSSSAAASSSIPASGPCKAQQAPGHLAAESLVYVAMKAYWATSGGVCSCDGARRVYKGQIGRTHRVLVSITRSV